MSTASQELLQSFDHLPPAEKREVASEIFRRAFVINPETEIDERQLAALYREFAAADSALAEQGIEDYEKGLVGEETR